MKKLANIFKAISHPTRMEIAILLSGNNELTVNEIKDKVNKPQAMVSGHLIILKGAGLVKSSKQSTHNFYSLTDKGSSMVTCIQSMARKHG